MKQKSLALVGLVALLSSVPLSIWVGSQEVVTLATPVQVDPGVEKLRLTMLHLDWPNQLVVIQLRAWDGTNFLNRSPLEYRYEGSNAVVKMRQLNTNNFSVNSLQKKAMQMLANDFTNLSGTISGPVE